MTEPSSPRPVPGPPPADRAPADRAPADRAPADDRFADLSGRPVAEHVEVFEDEHARLQAELGTIDRL